MPKKAGKLTAPVKRPAKEDVYVSQADFDVAVTHGDADTVRDVISRGAADINKPYNKIAPILHAMKGGHYNVAEILIDAGCNMKVSHKENHWKSFSPLFYAIKSGDIELVKKVLSGPAATWLLTKLPSYHDQRPTETAVREGHMHILKYLVDRGSPIGRALSEAVIQDNDEMFRYLMDEGCTLAFCPQALNVSINQGKTSMALELLDTTDINDMTQEHDEDAIRTGNKLVLGKMISMGLLAHSQRGADCMLKAVRHHQTEVLDMFISACPLGATGLDTPALEVAITQGFTDIVYKLLENGCPIDIELGVNDYLPLVTACELGNLELVQKLVERGADVNAEVLARQGKISDCFTALCAVACCGNMSITDLLITKGAEVNYVPGNYQTAVYCACRYGQESVLQRLVNAGAELKAHGKEKKFTSPLYAAIDKNHSEIVKILLDNDYPTKESGTYIIGPGPERTRFHLARAAEGNMVEIVQMLLEKGVDVNETFSLYKLGCPPAVWFAAQGGCSTLVKMLKRAGADLNVTDKKCGRTPIMACLWEMKAVYGDNTHVNSKSKYPDFIDTVELLLDFGCDTNKKSCNGKETTLMHGIYGLPDAHPLLRRIARLDGDVVTPRPIIPEHFTFRDQWGPPVQTPIQWAAYNEKTETMKMFMDMGVDLYGEQWWGNSKFMANLRDNKSKLRDLKKYADNCARKTKSIVEKRKTSPAKAKVVAAGKGKMEASTNVVTKAGSKRKGHELTTNVAKKNKEEPRRTKKSVKLKKANNKTVQMKRVQSKKNEKARKKCKEM